MLRSLGVLATNGRNWLAKDLASAQVMCIFQFPAITTGRDAVPTGPLFGSG